MTDEIMFALARNYLTKVERLPNVMMTLEQFLRYTVDVYNERKEQGLEQ